MALLSRSKWSEAAEEERLRLASGEKPRSRFQSGLQRTAARALAAFFALMLVLTLLSRAADGATVARVGTQRARTGILTQRVTVSGSLQPLGDLDITLPGGILVRRVAVKQGERVQAGDTLMELDMDDLQNQLTSLREKLRIVELRLQAAETGTTSTDMDAVLAAEQALADAREDYERLTEKNTAQESRAQEDLQDAQSDYDKALADYDRAVERTKEDLVKAAEEKAEGAEKELASVKEAAELAVESAQQSLVSAQDTQKSHSSAYYNSVDQLDKLRDGWKRAQEELQALVDAGADEEAIAGAQAAVDAAAEQVHSAEWNLDSYNYGPDLAVKRAEQNLEKVRERQEKKVADAEEELQKAKDELEKVKARTDLTGESAVMAAQSAVESAEKALRSVRRGLEDSAYTAEDALYSAQRAVEAAQRSLDTAQRKAQEAADAARRSDEGDRRKAEIERLGYLAEKRELERDIAALNAAASSDGRLTAPADGTVRSILAEPGKTQAGVRLCVLTRSDGGYRFEGKLTEEEAKDLAVGDEGGLGFTYGGKSVEVKAQITSIGAPDQDGRVMVAAGLPEGAYPDGVTASLELSKRSEQYSLVLPLTALRGEGEDTFVLVLQERKTVMGNEQTVIKLPVTVKERDSKLMAVEGAFLGTEEVVVSASKPIGEGDRVRLETTDDQ